MLCQEFYSFTETPPPSPVLSYWSPNTKELATGLTTPPVIMTNDGAISYFFKHLAAHPTMNLFVTFPTENLNQKENLPAEQPPHFTTPIQPIKLSFNTPKPTSTAPSKFPSFSLFDEDELLEETPLYPPKQNNSLHHSTTGTSAAAPKPHCVSLADETPTCGDEMFEEMFKEDVDNIPDGWITDDDDDDVPESSQPPDIEAVPVRGYDHDFWDPLLAETLGGSDVAAVMNGVHVPNTAPETYQCTTGNVFVRLSGEDNTDWKKDLYFLGVHMRDSPSVRATNTSTRTTTEAAYTPVSSVHQGSSSKRTPRSVHSPHTPTTSHGSPPTCSCYSTGTGN
ncbi:hypothetical protein HA466_0286890 [Hirschfeldia incana]|nr:hypothetical protein HA466_0286890 [Hirschfeldia incana]